MCGDWCGQVPAFVHSPRLAKEVRGTSFSGLVHVSDWAPTLVLGAADIEPDVDTANFDGYNLWGAFNELNVRAWVVPPPRRRLLSLIFSPATLSICFPMNISLERLPSKGGATEHRLCGEHR